MGEGKALVMYWSRSTTRVFGRNQRFRYLRWCWAKAAPDCQDPFESESKRGAKVCPQCKELLTQLKIDVWRYRKMEMEPWTEEIEYVDADHCTITFREQSPLKDKEQKLVGHTDHNTVIKTTWDELKENLENRKISRDNIARQLEVAKQRIERLGNKPAKSAEMVRLERCLEALAKINAINQANAEVEAKEKELAREESFIRAREASLAKRPE